MKSEAMAKVITIHPEGDISVGAQFHRCGDVSPAAIDVNLTVALREKSGITITIRVRLLGNAHHYKMCICVCVCVNV